MPGSVFRANTSGAKATCTTWLTSSPSTKRINQKTTTRTQNGTSDRNDWCTMSGTPAGILITRLASAKTFWTRTAINATRIAVNSPCDPRPGMSSVWFSGSI